MANEKEKIKPNEQKENLSLEQRFFEPEYTFEKCDLDKVSEFIQEFDPKNSKYKRTLEAQGYVAARRAKTGSYANISKNLGLPYAEFKYYLDTQPEFAAAIRKGILDGKEELKDNLIDTLVKKATGHTIEETSTTDEYYYNSEGEKYIGKTKVITTRKEIPADTQAALKLIEQLDPAWRPKNQLDVNVTSSLDINVTENVMHEIDLKSLSPDALAEILNSSMGGRNVLANKREDGSSIRSKVEEDVIVVEEKPKRKMSEETKQKIRDARRKTKEGKENKKKELEEKLKLEELRNG